MQATVTDSMGIDIIRFTGSNGGNSSHQGFGSRGGGTIYGLTRYTQLADGAHYAAVDAGGIYDPRGHGGGARGERRTGSRTAE